MRTARPVHRRVRRTVLLVGEGTSEENFLRHLKNLYMPRNVNIAITLKNARGKGAGHVVDFTSRHARHAAYDICVALLDTDTDWNEQTQARARKLKVTVLPAEPCLEAVLLAIDMQPVNDRLTLQLKQEFARRFGTPASDLRVFQQHFLKPTLDTARLRIPLLNQLLNLMETGRV